MNGRNWIFSCCFRRAIVLALVFFAAFKPAAAQDNTVVLRDEPIAVAPKEFYIANITDEREDRGAVASLILPNQAKNSSVDLQGGGFTAIKKFIYKNLSRNTALRPVNISLKQFMVTETARAGGLIDGNAAILLSFSMENSGGDTIHLIDYNGSTAYTRSSGPAQDVEPTMRKMVENGLVYLNTWMNRQAAADIKLAQAVKINFTDYSEKPEGDTIYYAARRPLTWGDFQSKTAAMSYAAEVFPTFGYDEHKEVAKGVINVAIVVKVSFPKSAAWAREASKSDYTLNHEQRHFDIAKIAAERFKQRVSSRSLTVDNYEAVINEEYLNAYREMSEMQRQYDNETAHGTNHATQEQWNRRITGELKK
jgi:hypothetical protein